MSLLCLDSIKVQVLYHLTQVSPSSSIASGQRPGQYFGLDILITPFDICSSSILTKSTYVLRKINPTWALFLVNLTTCAKILPTEMELEIYKMQDINHNKHSRTNTSTTIEHGSHAQKGNKCNINPEAEFSKFKNVGTVN
jgi:hypothetical protein